MTDSTPEKNISSPEKSPKKNKTLIGILVLLFIVLSIAGGYLFYRVTKNREARDGNEGKENNPVSAGDPAPGTVAGASQMPKQDEIAGAPDTPGPVPTGIIPPGTQNDGGCPGNHSPGEECDGQGGPPGGHHKKYALHSPYNHRICCATSKDGLNWKVDEKILFDHCSVPGALIRNGIIYLYFVDWSGKKFGISVAISKDNGKTFKKYKLKENFLDPNPVLLNDGRIKIYYFRIGGGICSVVSEDGINFRDSKIVYDELKELKRKRMKDSPRDRAKRSIELMDPGKMPLTDPDVFKTEKDWRMLISRGESLQLLVSDDDGKTFQKQNDFSWNQGGVSDTVKFDNLYRTYYGGKGTIRSAVGADKGKLTPEPGIRIRHKENFLLSSPAVIKLPDGTYKMYYVLHKIRPPLHQNNAPPEFKDDSEIKMIDRIEMPPDRN